MDYTGHRCQVTTHITVFIRHQGAWRACTMAWWVPLPPEVTIRHRRDARVVVKRAQVTIVFRLVNKMSVFLDVLNGLAEFTEFSTKNSVATRRILSSNFLFTRSISLNYQSTNVERIFKLIPQWFLQIHWIRWKYSLTVVCIVFGTKRYVQLKYLPSKLVPMFAFGHTLSVLQKLTKIIVWINSFRMPWISFDKSWNNCATKSQIVPLWFCETRSQKEVPIILFNIWEESLKSFYPLISRRNISDKNH